MDDQQTIYAYKDFITKTGLKEYTLNFPYPVKIRIGRFSEIQLLDVKSITFKCEYMTLKDLYTDFSRGKPITHKRVIITKYNTDKPIQRKKQKGTIIDNGIYNSDEPDNVFGSTDMNTNGLISSSCNDIDSAMYNPYDSYGLSLTTDYLASVSVNEYAAFSSANSDKKEFNKKDGNLDNANAIDTHFQYIFIITKRKNHMGLIDYKNSNGELINGIIDVKDKYGSHFINNDIDDSDGKEHTLEIVTEHDGLLIGRCFTEHRSKRGVEYVLNGQYVEYKLLKNGKKEPMNMLVFDMGQVAGNTEGNRQSLAEVVNRAQLFDKDLVKRHFEAKYANRGIHINNDYGNNESKHLMF